MSAIDSYELNKQLYIRRLSSNLYYPEEAKKLNLEGTTIVRADISRKGDVIGITIVESSGHTILDTAAMRTIFATRFPRHSAPEPVTVLFPVRYK